MARIAQESGGLAVLLPKGVSVIDAPWEVIAAIEHSNTVLSWFKNLSSDETPPRWMLPFPDELDEWFSEVELARQAKYGSDDNDDNDYAGMEVNELAK